MREQYWDWYVNFKYKIEYLIAYKIRKDRLSDIYSAVLLLASAAGIASLSFGDSVPILWGAITLAAQVMQTIKPKIPSFRQGPALNYILQDLERYFLDVKSTWYNIDNMDDTEIQAFICEIDSKVESCEERFSGDLNFPIVKSCAKKAGKRYEEYFRYYFGIDVKGDS